MDRRDCCRRSDRDRPCCHAHLPLQVGPHQQEAQADHLRRLRSSHTVRALLTVQRCND